MLSFKSIAGFLKKVSSTGGRDEGHKDARQKAGSDGAAGVNNNNSSSNPTNGGNGAGSAAASSASEGVASARSTPATNKATASTFPGSQGGRKGDEMNYIESPLFGMTAAFGDTSMFTSSGILKGLAPNTSTSDVLQHIHGVVQQRSAELQLIEDEDEEERAAEALAGVRARAAAAAAAVSAARNSLDVATVSPRSSQSLLSTAVPSPADTPANSVPTLLDTNTLAASNASPDEGNKESKTVSGGNNGGGNATPAKAAREKLHRVQKMRAEMIDALDVCLQEVPEEVLPIDAPAPAVGSDEEKQRADRANEEPALQESMTRSSSVVLPSSLTTGQSALADAVAAAAEAAESANEWDAVNASLEGVRTETGTVSPRNGSVVATPNDAAELSMAAAATAAAASPEPSPSAVLRFTHYEWRCLLLRIVEVLVRIDRLLIHETRRRATERLTPGLPSGLLTHASAVGAAAAGGGGGPQAEFRWQRLSQVLPVGPEKSPMASAAGAKSTSVTLTPTRQSQQVDVAAAAAVLLNSPHLSVSRLDAAVPRTPEDGESLLSTVPATAVASGQATPREALLPPSTTAGGGGGGGGHATNVSGGHGLAAHHHIPSPLAKVKHALVENGVLSPDTRVDYSISKDDKKVLEELLTVACSLATWAIIKAILRHHLQTLTNLQRKIQLARTGGSSSSSGANGNALGNNANAAAGAAVLPVVATSSSEKAALDMSLSATTTELAGTGNSTTSGNGGRPPLAPAPPPPLSAPAALNANFDDAAGDDTAAPLGAPKKTSSTAPAITAASIAESYYVDDIPYIDWEAVVQELGEWLDNTNNNTQHIIAECTLCASFLRDDGREMVMCMLQKPKPRRLLSNIHRHAEKLRHTDPTAALATNTNTGSGTAAASASTTGSLMASPRGTTAATTAGVSSSGSSATATATVGGATAAGGGAAAGLPSNAGASATSTTVGAAGSGAGVAPPSPTIAKAGSGAAPTPILSMLDDPTLVMDDLVAQLELVYRRAVGDTWSGFLESAIEAEMTSAQLSSAYGSGAGLLPHTASEATMENKSGTDEETSPAVPQSSATGTVFSEDPLPKQPSGISTQSTASSPASPLTKAYISDTKTLCRLATAYFFGSDAWSDKKRERRFAVLYRSMRTRMDRYSESAATRRNIRRGTSSAASPVQTTTTTAVASPVEPNPFSDLSPSPAASPPQTSRPSLQAATTASASHSAPPATGSSIRASPLQSSASPPAAVPATTALTPTKFSVEDTSSRAVTAHGGGTANTTTTNNNTNTNAAAAATAMSRHGLVSSQLVSHQLLSSNASNAAGSTHSTPLAASLQISRDGGYSDIEAASGVSGPGTLQNSMTAHSAHHAQGTAEHYTQPMPEQSATWTPFGFMMTPSETMTPPPERQQQQQQQNAAQVPSAMGVTPLRHDEDSASPSFFESSGMPPPPPPSSVHQHGSSATPLNSITLAPPQQPQPQQPQASSSSSAAYPVYNPLAAIVLERIVNMSWSAALHKRGEQCLTAKPPRLEEAEQNAQEERLVAGAFGEFRARQRSLVSLINARLASGKSVEALMNAQKHFRFEKKDWTSHSQTIFSALRYLQSMVLLVRAQAACRVYGAVIETVQFVLPQATLCEQMLQVLAPRPRRDCILRFADCRAKLLRSYVYLLKECWLAHAAFNDHAKAAKYFSQCAQVLQMLRRRARESELFAAYMERGSQLMKMKDYKKSVELFRLAVNIAKKSLQDADAAAAANASATASAAPSLGSTLNNAANAVSTAAGGLATKSGGGPGSSSSSLSLALNTTTTAGTAAAPQQQFHRNMHFRGAGSGLLYTAEEHSVGTSAATADDLEFAWRVAESERMLALSFVTQAEHEVNVRERREELSNAVSNAYSSQRALQRWQTKGGTPKRLLTAVPCSLIVICKGLLLLNQARKAALLLEPLIENKPSSALVRPPMWREILDPTEDPYTAEDVVLRTYVCSVKIAVYMLYARCLAEFDGERALRAVTQVDQLLQESDAWIYAIRTQLRRALEEVRLKDKATGTTPTSPCIARNLELPRVAAKPAAEDNDDTQSTTRQGHGGADTVVSAASTTATAGTGLLGASTGAGAAMAKTTEVPPLRISSVTPAAAHANNASTTNNASTSITTTATTTGVADNVSPARMPSSCGSHHSPEANSPEENSLRPRRSTVVVGPANAMGGGGAASSSIGPSREDLLHDDDDRSRPTALLPTSGGSVNADLWNCSATSALGAPNSPALLNNNANNNANNNNNNNVSLSSMAMMPVATGTAAGAPQSPASAPSLRIQMESASECMTALFALREGKSHIRKALRDIFIVSGDAHSLIKNWEEALKSYSHALVISMSEVEAANAAAQSRRRVSQFTTPRNAAPSPRSSVAGNVGGVGGHDELNSPATSQGPTVTTGVANASHQATAGGSSHRGGGGGGSAGVGGAAGGSSAQCWGQVVPLDEEFFLWDEEDVLIADNMVNRELTASTAAKDLRAVVADEERMDSRACESLVLSKLANVYRALDKPTTAIHYHNLVLDYANECNDKLLAYNSMLSLARLYTSAASMDEARDTWAKVSELAKDYEDKEVSRETMRNIVAGQETAGMYLDVVKTAEDLEKLATGEEGEDAAADRRFALEALANANLQLGQYDACITALDNREKVQEKSAEWNGRLLSMRAKARMGLNKPAEAIKVMQSWAAKARNLGNWVELGMANSALSAAYASENQNMQARQYHEATLNAFALAENLSEDCQHIALDSARWLVHYAYLDDATVQVDPSLTYAGGCLTSDSEASGGDFRYADSNLCNSSGDLGMMLAKEEEMRRSSSSLIADSMRVRDGSHKDDDDDDDDFFSGGGTLSNHSLFGMRAPPLSDSDRPADTPKAGEEGEDEDDDDEGRAAGQRGEATARDSSPPPTAAGAEEEAEEEASDRFFNENLSNSFQPKDPNCATQPPSLAASVNAALPDYAAHLDSPDLNFSGSSAGQSEVGDSDAVVEEADDETRRRREVEEALLTMDDDIVEPPHPPLPPPPPSARPEGADAAVAAAVAAAAQNDIFFRMDDDDDDSSSGGKPNFKVSSASSAAPPTPNITTAALKTAGNAAAAGGTKSASSNYVPPPTALANVSICSRPAAAAAGTDVLEMPVGGSRSVSEPTSGSGPSGTGSPLLNSGGRGATFADGGALGVAGLAQDGDDGHHERKPATVRTTYYRGAIEMMETAAQLLLVPRSVSRMVVPYSPAEAVDFALLAHPHSLFVFYFAEYTTEYGAQCDVVVRPPGTAGFMKLRAQISLKEYHSKDVVSSLLSTMSAEVSVVGSSSAAATNADPGASISHPFGGAMAKAAAGGSSSAGASPTLANVRPDALRAALDDETRSCLRNLHADAWQPIIDRMHRDHVSYQDAETVIIMPDIALLHLPFAGLLPSPDYGGEEAPLGEQFTLVVTPSLTHFVYHSMSQPVSQKGCGALDPTVPRYIFLPYDAAATTGGVPLPTGGVATGGGGLSVPSSPRPRQQASSQAVKAAPTTTTATAAAGKPTTSTSSAASPASWPVVSPAHSGGDSVLTTQTSATAANALSGGNAAAMASALRRDSALADPSYVSASAAVEDGSFDGLLKSWRVHRGCTRKELIHAFTDSKTRALMFLGPIDVAGVRVADGVVTMQDIMQSLQQARSQQQQTTAQGSSGAAATGSGTAASGNAPSGSSGSANAGTNPLAITTSTPPIPLPPLCTHMDLLILTADRAMYPTVTNGGMTANLCMSLGVHRVLRLNVVHGLSPNEEHREFIAQYFLNLRKVMRWSLDNPYAVALRTTIAEARAKGMSSNTWGAFTLVGSA